MTDIPADVIQVGQTLMKGGLSHFSVFEKLNTRTVTGLRGTSVNTPTGRTMIHVDFRWILSNDDDFNNFSDIIAQFKATPFLPFKNPVLRALIMQYSNEVTSKEDIGKTVAALNTTLDTLNVSLSELWPRFNSFLEDTIFTTTRKKKIVDLRLLFRFVVSLYSQKDPTDTVQENLNRLMDEVVKLTEDDLGVVRSTQLASVKLLIKEQIKTGGLTSLFYKLLDTVRVINNHTEAIAKLDKPVSQSKIEIKDIEDDNIHLAVSQIEWMTVPDLKIGVIAKLSCVFFNHTPHIAKLKYYKHDGETTYDLANSDMFSNFRKRYQLEKEEDQDTIRHIGPNHINSDSDRCAGKCLKFNLSDAARNKYPTKLAMNIYDWEETTPEPTREDGTKLDLKTQQVLDDKKDLVVFAKEYNRVISSGHYEMEFGKGDEFIERIICSITFPMSIVPLLGNQHPTLQFYGRPTGTVQFILKYTDMDILEHDYSDIRVDLDNSNYDSAQNYKALRHMFEFARAKNNHSETKYKKFNPAVLFNPLVNMGGMYNFNIESMNTTNIENESGAVNTSLTFIEQIIPSIDLEKKLFGFREISNERGAGSFKLTEVMKFIADPAVKKRFEGNILEYYILRNEALNLITGDILTPEVWYNYVVRTNFPNIFKLKEKESGVISKVYTSGVISSQGEFNKNITSSGNLLSNCYLFKEATEDGSPTPTESTGVEIDENLLISLRYLYEIIDIMGTIKNNVISGETKTYSQYGDASGEMDPMNMSSITGVSNFIVEFLNTLTLNIFENGAEFKGIPRDGSSTVWTHKAILNFSDGREGKIEEDDLPVPSSLIGNLDTPDQQIATKKLGLDRIVENLIVDQLHKILGEEYNLPDYAITVVIELLRKDHRDKKIGELSSEDLEAYLDAFSNHTLAVITASIFRTTAKVGSNLRNLEFVTAAADGSDVKNISRFKTALTTFSDYFRTKEVNALIQEVKAVEGTYAKLVGNIRIFIESARTMPLRTAAGTIIKPIALTIEWGGRAFAFVTSKAYSGVTLGSGIGGKLITGTASRMLPKSMTTLLKGASKPLFVLDILLSAAIAYHRNSSINDKANNLQATVSIGIYQIMSGVLYNMLNSNKVPNDKVTRDLYNILALGNVPSSAKTELDDLYLKISSFSEGNVTRNKATNRLSAYPDMNLPTYGEVAGISPLTDAVTKQEITNAFNQLNVEVNSLVEVIREYKVLKEDNITKLTDALTDVRNKVTSYASLKDGPALSLAINNLGQTVMATGSIISLVLRSTKSAANPLFFSASLANVTNQLTSLNSVLNVAVPTSVEMIIPRYDEVHRETPYVSDPYTDAGKFFARDVNDFVDPGFYIVRQTKNPAKLLNVLNEDGQSISDILNMPSDGTAPRVSHIGLPKPIIRSTLDWDLASALRYGKSFLPGVTQHQSVITDDNIKYNSDTFTEYTVGNTTWFNAQTTSGITETKSDKHLMVVTPQEQKEKEEGVAYQSYLFQSEKASRHSPTIRENISSAFPTYAVYFIREVETLEYEREFMSDIYLYQNVIDLNITSNKFTGHVATLTLANIWGTLDNNSFKRTINDPKPTELARPKDIESRLRFESMRLSEGVLIEIRHGYSANPDELDIVFTGKIAEVSAGEIVTIICQGHESELMSKSMKSLDVGLVTGRNMYDYAAQLMMHTKHFGEPYGLHSIKQLVKERTAHRTSIYGGDGKINLFESLLTSNLNVSRTTENIWVGSKVNIGMDWMLNQDFVLKDTTELEALHEISRYHYNHVAFPLPMDSRATMFLGPVDHLYKYTNKLNVQAASYINANSAIQRFANTDNLISNPDDLRNSDNSLDVLMSNVITRIPEMFTSYSVLYINRATAQSRRSRSTSVSSILNRVHNNASTGGRLNNMLARITAASPEYIIASPTRILRGTESPVMEIIDYYSFTSEFINVPIRVKVNIANAILTQFIITNMSAFSDTKWMAAATAKRVSNLKKADDFLYSIKGNTNASAIRAYADKRIENEKLSEFYGDVDARNKDAALAVLKGILTDNNIQRLIRGLEAGGMAYAVEDVVDKLLESTDKNSRYTALQLRLMYITIITWFSNLINASTDPDVLTEKADAVIQRGIVSKMASQTMPPGYKPFRSFHRVTDRDIVANELECTVSQMANEVHVMTPKDSTQFVSRALNGVKEVLQMDPSETQGYWHNNISSFSIFQSPSAKLIRRMYEPNANTMTQQANITYRDLAEAMKSMYRGQLILVGRRSIKPYDVISLSDSYNNVQGDFEVESVTHSHSIDGGWITTVTPHLLNTHAEMESSMARFWYNAGVGAVEGMLQFMLLRSLAFSVGGKVKTLFADNAFSKAALMNTGTSVLLGDFATKGIGISLIGDAADGARAIINSDAAVADWFFKPTAITCGIGMSPEDYNLEREAFGAGNTSIPDHLKPVILNPLIKDGEPWVAGLTGIRRQDTSTHWGTAGALFSQAIGQGKVGIKATKYDIDVGFKKIFNKYDILYRNFYNL